MKTTFILATLATFAGGMISTVGSQDLANKSLPATLAAEPDLGIFTSLVKAAGLQRTLQLGGPYTVLAPTDAAFRMLPDGTLDELMKPANKHRLTDLIGYHIVPGNFPSAKIDLEERTTLQGSRIVLNREAGVIWIGRAEVLRPDLESANGTIHVVNMVLEPDPQ